MNRDLGNKVAEFARILKEEGYVAADKFREDNKNVHGDFSKYCEGVALYVAASEVAEESLA